MSEENRRKKPDTPSKRKEKDFREIIKEEKLPPIDSPKGVPTSGLPRTPSKPKKEK